MGVSGLSRYGIETLVTDIDFTSQTSKDTTIDIGKPIRDVLRGRFYIDADPGAPFDQWATFTFYNKAAKKGEDAFYRTVGKIIYTELEVATTGSDADITPDDHNSFMPNDLVYILDTSTEIIRLMTVADTMVAEDTIGAHAIDVGLARVSEFNVFSLINLEDGTDVYFRVAFPTAQTVSLKLELILRA